MALNLYGRGNRFRREHFVEAGARLGLRERATNRMIDALIEVAATWADRCEEIGFTDRDTERLANLLRERIGALT